MKSMNERFRIMAVTPDWTGYGYGPCTQYVAKTEKGDWQLTTDRDKAEVYHSRRIAASFMEDAKRSLAPTYGTSKPPSLSVEKFYVKSRIHHPW